MSFLLLVITNVVLSMIEDKNQKLIDCFLIIRPVIYYTVGFVGVSRANIY